MSNLTSLKKKAADQKNQRFISQADKGRAGERGKRLNVEIPEDLHHRVKVVAAERGLTVRELVIQCLRKDIKPL